MRRECSPVTSSPAVRRRTDLARIRAPVDARVPTTAEYRSNPRRNISICEADSAPAFQKRVALTPRLEDQSPGARDDLLAEKLTDPPPRRSCTLLRRACERLGYCSRWNRMFHHREAPPVSFPASKSQSSDPSSPARRRRTRTYAAWVASDSFSGSRVMWAMRAGSLGASDFAHTCAAGAAVPGVKASTARALGVAAVLSR